MSKFVPAKNFVIANNKITKIMFDFSEQEYNVILSKSKHIFNIKGKIVDVSKKDGKKTITQKQQIIYPCRWCIVEDKLLKLTDAERQYLDVPPNLFDRLIFSALVSAYCAGIKEISVSALYRIITGKNGTNFKPSKDQAAEILKSVKKLACLQIRMDMSAAFQFYVDKNGKPKYNDGKPLVIDFTPIIPCRIVDGIFQGNSVQMIQFTAESPLYRVARILNQVLIVPTSALCIGNTRNTTTVASVKFYTLIRALEIQGGDYLKDTITFNDVFTKCGIKSAFSKVKADERDIIFAVMLNLQELGILKTFEVVREAGEYVKINLKYPPKKRKK